MDYLTPLTALVADMTAAGLRATTTRQTLNPPGVLVTVDQIDAWTYGATSEVRLRLYAVVGDLNEERALEKLQPLLLELTDYMDANNLPHVEPITAELVASADGGAALPAFKATTTILAN